MVLSTSAFGVIDIIPIKTPTFIIWILIASIPLVVDILKYFSSTNLIPSESLNFIPIVIFVLGPDLHRKCLVQDLRR